MDHRISKVAFDIASIYFVTVLGFAASSSSSSYSCSSLPLTTMLASRPGTLVMAMMDQGYAVNKRGKPRLQTGIRVTVGSSKE